MANDRIWIRCAVCGNQLLLAKYYPGDLEPYHTADRYHDWLKTHLACREAYSQNLKGDPGLTIFTESAWSPDQVAIDDRREFESKLP